jgi:hypothetical protein
MTNSLSRVWFRESFPERQITVPGRVIWFAVDGAHPVARHVSSSPGRAKVAIQFSGGRTGRSDISVHIMDHISLMMIAGRQKKIGMSISFAEINSTPRSKVPDPRITAERLRNCEHQAMYLAVTDLVHPVVRSGLRSPP